MDPVIIILEKMDLAVYIYRDYFDANDFAGMKKITCCASQSGS